ncbi:HNH endonuclease [Pseudobowmanella zhangzhouensis]|uniref:HNH endonuclease n=1 Tax=Pseudobowmanella zhangzhouensis TaxID=1537679 RepID=UPI00103C5E6E
MRRLLFLTYFLQLKNSRSHQFHGFLYQSCQTRCQQTFERHGNQCLCCTADPAQGAVLQVDHVKPRAKFPELALDINNLQILCEICNIGKLHHSESDWR